VPSWSSCGRGVLRRLDLDVESHHDVVWRRRKDSQLGHSWASTTAIYTGVSGDYQNRMLRDVLDRRLPVGPEG
jgi:hypothetical protein